MKSLIRMFLFTRPFIWQMLVAILLGFATVAANVGLLGTSAYLIARAALHPSISELQVAIVGVRFFGLARGILRYLERMQTHTVNFKILGQIRTWFYAALEPLPPQQIQGFQSGDIFSRVMEDVETLDNYFVRAAAPIATALSATLAMGVFTGYLAGGAGYIIIGGMLISGVGAPMLAYSLGRRAGEQIVTRRGQVSSVVLDFYAGMRDLLAFDQSESWKKRIKFSQKEWYSHQERSFSAQAWADGLVMLGSYLTLIGVLIYAIPLVQADKLSGVIFVVLAIVTLAGFEVVGWVNPAVAQLGACARSAQRLMEIVDAKPIDVVSAEEELVLNGLSLEINHLWFAYPDQPDWHLGPLEGLTLEKGERIGLVGPSGCGKTTLLNILIRNLEYSGDIQLGGVSLDCFTPEGIHTILCAPTQSNHIFNASLLNNMALAGPGDETEIMQALKSVELREWTERLPQGLNTLLGNLGMGLSGGEHTRLALARCILRNPEIYLFDEPTVHLDVQTEKRVMRTIFELTRSKSVIWASHRLAGMDMMDRIYVLNQGEIVEQGTHDDLIGQKGLYARMWEIQHRMI